MSKIVNQIKKFNPNLVPSKRNKKTIIVDARPSDLSFSNSASIMFATYHTQWKTLNNDWSNGLTNKETRKKAWALLRDTCALKGVKPVAVWPKGTAQDYLKHLETMFTIDYVHELKPIDEDTELKEIQEQEKLLNEKEWKEIEEIVKDLTTPPPGITIIPNPYISPKPIKTLSVLAPPASPEFDPFSPDEKTSDKLIVPKYLIKEEQEAKRKIDFGPCNPCTISTPVISPVSSNFNSPFEPSQDELNDTILTPYYEKENSKEISLPPSANEISKQEYYESLSEFSVCLNEAQASNLNSPTQQLWNQHVQYCIANGVTPTSPLMYPNGDVTPLQNEIWEKNKVSFKWKKSYNRWKGNYQKYVPRILKAQAKPKLEKTFKEPKEVEPVSIDPASLQEKIIEFQKNLSLPPIKLLGGMKQAVPPHLNRNSRLVPVSPLQNNLSVSPMIDHPLRTQESNTAMNFFNRNLVVQEGRNGVGMREYLFVFNPNCQLSISPALMPFASKLAKIACQRSIELAHGRAVGGVFPKIQFVYHNLRTGQFKKSKCVDTQNSNNLGGAFFDERFMYGGSDPDEEWGGTLHSIRILAPSSIPRGGCDSRQHTFSFTDYRVRTMKSTGNNCGIACLTYKQKLIPKRTFDQIRTHCNINLNDALSFEELEIVATFLKCGFRIWQIEQTILSVVYNYGLDKERIVDILHNPITKHYSILILKNDRKQCTLCGKYIRNKEKHICASRVVNFYRHFHKYNMTNAAEYKEVEDEPRDLNSVYIFDLETFAPDPSTNIHVPYACKMKNLGTGETWLRYGNDNHILQDIVNISKRGIPIIYEDENPGQEYGRFRYKIKATDKKWLYMKYTKPLTQEEAARECNLRLRELICNEAARLTGYYGENDEVEKKMYIYQANQVKVMEWDYSDYSSKEQVELRLKELKNYEECVFVAHNLSRFDGSFLLNYLISENIDVQFCINSGRILKMEWYKSKVWDSCCFMADSLKNIAINFKCKIQKGDFDHKLIQSWEDVHRYKEQAPNDHIGWGPYLDADVDSLAEIVEKYSTQVYENFNADVFKYVTLSSLTYKLWGQTTLKNNIVIETPQTDKYHFIRDAVFGGRVFPMQKKFATSCLNEEEEKLLQHIYHDLDLNIDLEDIKYDDQDLKNIYQKIFNAGSFVMNMDMNSLYPTAMCLEYPVGIGEWSTHPQQDFENGYMGIYHISFEAPKNLIMAILPQRNKEYTSFVDDEKLNKQWKGSGIKWSLENNEGVYTNIDIQMALQYGYKITFKNKAIIWKTKNYVFKDYIEEIYKIKKQQDTLKGTPEYNEVIRTIAKTMMNALYGKTCQRPIQDEHLLIKNENEFYEFTSKYLLNDYIWIKQNGQNVLAVSGSPLEIENSKPSHLGAFVLAYSRKLMMEDFHKVTNGLKEFNFTYTDTDSIHMKGDAYKTMVEKYPERFGKELGQFSNDIDKGKNPIIIYEYCLAPKCYMYVWISEDGKMGIKKKVKGIPKQVMKKLTMNDFENENEIKLDFESLKRCMFHKEDPFTIKNNNAHRTFLKNKWNKMNYDPITQLFVPYNYDPSYISNDDQPMPQIQQAPYDLSKFETHKIYGQNIDYIDWYFKQEPALHRPEKYLIKWVNMKLNKKPVHHFTRLNLPDIITILESKKETGAHLYEVTEEGCCLYADIDLKYSHTKCIPKEIILNQVIECMKFAADKFHVDLQDEDLFITSACTDDMAIDSKYSFHITSPKHIFPTPAHQKTYWETVFEISKNYPDLNYKEENCFDLCVYHKHRAFRTIYSCKPGKAILKPIDVDCKPLTDVDIKDYLICRDINHETSFSELSKEYTDQKIKRAHNVYIIKPKGTLAKEIQDLLKLNKDILNGFDIINGEVSNNIVRLDRIASGHCESCKRNHQHENGYVVYKTKKPYFICYRNPKEKIYLNH